VNRPDAERSGSVTPSRGEEKREISGAIENLLEAQRFAMSIRPKVCGFPYLAETLRQAGVTRNVWSLPSLQSLYLTERGPVIVQGTPLASGAVDVPKFDRDGLVRALRTDQAGESTFAEFLQSAWRSGVIGYEADFALRRVTYFGATGEQYVEDYPAVEVIR